MLLETQLFLEEHVSHFVMKAGRELGFVRQKFGWWTTFQEYIWLLKERDVSAGLLQLLCCLFSLWRILYLGRRGSCEFVFKPVPLL